MNELTQQHSWILLGGGAGSYREKWLGGRADIFKIPLLRGLPGKLKGAQKLLQNTKGSKLQQE